MSPAQTAAAAQHRSAKKYASFVHQRIACLVSRERVMEIVAMHYDDVFHCAGAGEGRTERMKALFLDRVTQHLKKEIGI